MKVLIINSVCGIRSTGRICTDIAETYMQEGHEVRIAYGRENVPEKYQDISVRIGTTIDVYLAALKTRLLDNEGFNNTRATRKFLKWAEDYNPDVLWLHNLHGYYINIELLFAWIKTRPEMEVKWTLHDCWAFTGHCSHFSYVKCEKWKTGCNTCIQKKEYPASIFTDRSSKNYRKKSVSFCDVNQMTIITPSQWLANLVRESFLKKYPIHVVHNKIDRRIFKSMPSNFREKYNLENKKIILGVATAWGPKKGLDDFVKLSKMINDDYQIVIVGLDKKQTKGMPKEILCIPKTNCVTELVEIYTAADVFLNLSYEETFGLTTVEAIACKTPIIVYKDTACEEICNIYGGSSVEQGNIKMVVELITSM